MALASRDPGVTARYNRMALEYLARADESELFSSPMRCAIFGDVGSDLDRD